MRHIFNIHIDLPLSSQFMGLRIGAEMANSTADIDILRCRFAQQPLPSIEVMTFSPDQKYLAIASKDGQIEIYNAQSWHQHAVGDSFKLKLFSLFLVRLGKAFDRFYG